MEMSRSFPGFDVTADVGQCRSIAYFVGKNGQLVLYSLMNRQPVQLLERVAELRVAHLDATVSHTHTQRRDIHIQDVLLIKIISFICCGWCFSPLKYKYKCYLKP